VRPKSGSGAYRPFLPTGNACLGSMAANGERREQSCRGQGADLHLATPLQARCPPLSPKLEWLPGAPHFQAEQSWHIRLAGLTVVKRDERVKPLKTGERIASAKFRN
jgi:hypothetical protein